jgi:hypothetical protein
MYPHLMVASTAHLRAHSHSLVEPQFDDPVYFTPNLRGIAWAKRDGNWCAIDRRGRRVAGIACADADPTGSSGNRFECKVEP